MVSATPTLCAWIPLQAGGEAQMLARMRAAAGVPAAAPEHGGVAADRIAMLDGVIAAIAGNAGWDDADLMAVDRERGAPWALLRAYQRDGTDLLAHFVGHGALFLHDPRRNLTLAATDRMTTVPVYYAATADGLAVATRLGAVRVCPGVDSAIALQALYDYVYFHCIPSPGTILRGVSKLQPAQAVWFEAGRVRTVTYWRPRFVAGTARVDAGALAADLRSSLRTAVIESAGDERPAAFLSGGLDSSTVAGYLQGHLGGKAHTFTIGFADAAGYDETEFAAVTARHFGTEHHVYRVTPEDVAGFLPQLAAALDEPFGNSSAVPTYFCAKTAREHGFARLLAGDGGDELFAGNTRYARQRNFEYYTAAPAPVRKAIEALYSVLPRLRTLYPFRKAYNYITRANTPLPDRLQLFNFLHAFDPALVFTSEFLRQVDPEAPLRAWRARYEEADADSSVDRMLYLDWKFTLADNDLVKVNSMCDLAGVTVGYPMLDTRLIDLSARVPADLKMPGRRLRQFYKDAMRGFLAEATLTKSKHGFGLPFGVWMRDDAGLQSIVAASVSRLAERGWLNASFIDEIRRLHRGEAASYYGEFLWILVVLELWLQAHA